MTLHKKGFIDKCALIFLKETEYLQEFCYRTLFIIVSAEFIVLLLGCIILKKMQNEHQFCTNIQTWGEVECILKVCYSSTIIEKSMHWIYSSLTDT